MSIIVILRAKCLFVCTYNVTLMNLNAPPSPVISNASTISPLTSNRPSNIHTSSSSTPTPQPSRRATFSTQVIVPARSPSTPASPTRKPRARELLRQHYGLTRSSSGGDIAAQGASGRRASAASVTSPVERPNDPMDLGMFCYSKRGFLKSNYCRFTSF